VCRETNSSFYTAFCWDAIALSRFRISATYLHYLGAWLDSISYQVLFVSNPVKICYYHCDIANLNPKDKRWSLATANSLKPLYIGKVRWLLPMKLGAFLAGSNELLGR
jgi:hypothetical protein